MKKIVVVVMSLFSLTHGLAQEIVELPNTDTKGVVWKNPEKQYFTKIWDTEVVTNVSKPTMQVFRPSSETNNGTAIVVAPGGALYALSIENEGNLVGKWLAEKGITAFVLKYRLVPTGEDGVAEVSELITNPQKMVEEVAKVLPYSIQDGLNAVTYVRENAGKYGLDPNKIGFMGFSAGGAVTMGVGYGYDPNNRPNFLVPVYPWTDVITVKKPKKDVPPTLIICATDDPLGLAKGSIELYESLEKEGKSVALQMYAKGGHGFGMRKQGLPSDHWIERFYEWSLAQALVEPKK